MYDYFKTKFLKLLVFFFIIMHKILITIRSHTYSLLKDIQGDYKEKYPI